MYNRYIPQPDGSFCRRQIPEAHTPHKTDCEPKKPDQPKDDPCQEEFSKPVLSGENRCKQCPNRRKKPCPEHSAPFQECSSFLSQILPKDFDSADLMVILLLLLMAGDCPENQSNALLTLALYLFL